MRRHDSRQSNRRLGGHGAARRARRLRPEVRSLEQRRLLATFVVNSPGDTSGHGLTTLRDAVRLAEQDDTPDTITFDPSLGGGTVVLFTVGDTSIGASALKVTTSITIDGMTTHGGVTITRSSGAKAMRLFDVTASGSLTLEDVNVTGGDAVGKAGSDTGAAAAGAAARASGGPCTTPAP